MTNSNANQLPETASPRMKMPEYPVDMPTIMRQIRLCRSKLGAILDELECGEGNANANAIEQIAECTTGVTAEIERLWEAIKKTD